MAEEMKKQEKEMEQEYKEMKKPGKVGKIALAIAGGIGIVGGMIGTSYYVSKGSAKGSSELISDLLKQVESLKTRNESLEERVKTAENLAESLKTMIGKNSMNVTSSDSVFNAAKETAEDVKNIF